MDPVRGLEAYDTVLQCKKSKITSLADELAGGVHIALLTDKDAARCHELTAEALDAAALGIRVAAVF